LDVEVEGGATNDPFSIVVYLCDDRQYEVFHTSTEYLGYPAISLEPGARFTCTFEMELNLAGGTFYFGVLLYRFNIEKTIDSRFPASTVFVNTLTDVRGVVNPHPRITSFEPVVAQQTREIAK
jgi:hypothetical protein